MRVGPAPAAAELLSQSTRRGGPVLKPTALLADEPTGNLDHRTGAEVVALLEALHHAGTMLIVVTHDRELGARAHRHIAMRDGEIVGDEHT